MVSLTKNKISGGWPRQRLLQGWIWAVGGVVVVFAIAAGIYLKIHWPYRGREVVPALAEAFSSTIEVKSYQRFYFPHPGFVAHNIVVRRHGSTDIPPLATIEQLTATGSYADFILAPHHLNSLKIDGLHVQIPAAGTDGNGTKFLSGGGGSSDETVVDQITANQSVLDIGTGPDGGTLHFAIHTLTLRNVSAKKAMTYQVQFTNPVPPGEITADGRLGPLRKDAIAELPLSGKFSLAGADLGSFRGIDGILHGDGKFSGTLSHIETSGGTDVPMFRVGGGKAEHVAANYHAMVDGTNGHVTLDRITATAGQTRVDASADIDRTQGWRVKFAVNKGRVQDMMQMFVEDGSPATGTATVRGTAFVPPEHHDFLRALQVDAGFSAGALQFTHHATQQSVNDFSQRASGDAPPKKDDANVSAPTVSAELKAPAVTVRNGAVHFAQLFFAIPGAEANADGSFLLTGGKVDLHGDLHMRADLSHVTTGVKALLLKPLDPIFKKKHNDTVVPVHMTGTYAHPLVGLDFKSKRSEPQK